MLLVLFAALCELQRWLFYFFFISMLFAKTIKVCVCVFICIYALSWFK